MRRRIAAGAGVLLVVVLAGLTWGAARRTGGLRDRAAGRVLTAVDGETVRMALDTGEMIEARLLGLHVPEDWQPGARAWLDDHIADRPATITLDGPPTRLADRAAVYLYTGGGTLVNERMVWAGYARIDKRTDHTLAWWLNRLARWAEKDNRGLWGR